MRTGKGEQLLGQAGAALRAVADAIEHPPDLVLIIDVAQRQFAGAEDRRQQIVEVVSKASGQLTERFHLLRPEQLLPRFLEAKPGLALFGHVAGDLGEADQFAGLVLDRVDDDACPELCPVLAHAPPLGFVPAGRPRRFERAFGNAGFEVLRGVEAAEMLADNLVGRIAFDTLRA